MFEKLYKKIDRIASDLKDYIKILSNQHEATRILISDVSRNIEKQLNNASKASKTIESQQRTIEQLTNALLYDNNISFRDINGDDEGYKSVVEDVLNKIKDLQEE